MGAGVAAADKVARYLCRRVVSWRRSSNVFLRNGARLYLDVGSHPEYATPECDSVSDLVVHDRAGERILEGLLVDAEKRLHDEGIAGDSELGGCVYEFAPPVPGAPVPPVITDPWIAVPLGAGGGPGWR